MTGAYKNRTSKSEAGAPEAEYRRRMGAHVHTLEALDGKARALGSGRLASFLAAAGCLVAALVGAEEPRTAWLAAAGLLAAAFVALVVVDARLRRRIESEDALRAVHERALARLVRDWPALERALAEVGLPASAAPGSGDGDGDGDGDGGGAGSAEAYVRDLHLFGRASLFRLAATPGTPYGRRGLAEWLTGPAGEATILARQRAVRALTPELDWRAGLEAATWGSPRWRLRSGLDAARARRGGVEAAGDPVLDRFYAWLAAEPWLLPRRGLIAAAWAFTVLTPATLVLWLVGVLPALWIPLAGGAYFLSVQYVKRMHEAFDRVTDGSDGLRGYGAIFRRLETLPGDAELLDAVRARLATEGRSAAQWMDGLDRLIVLSDTRRGMMYFFVQVLFLWDFHVHLRLERWRAAAGAAARGWLEALGEVEALAALAGLAHAEPAWAFPEVDAAADAFEGRELGHPLIPGRRRVGNDVTVGPPGTFLLVTGSNMSGKTTLLRAVGANAVLARAGAPVCARALRMPPVELATSVAVEDSLEEGVSFFLAELHRLKEVVAKAEAGVSAKAEEGSEGPRVLFLLDEVLRGTNSAERRVAVGRVVGRLLAVGAIGAVTTHDLEMLAAGDLEAAAHTLHFRETVDPRPGGGADMTFDYIARPGLATTTNALRLLEAVGLSLGAEREIGPDGDEVVP